MKILRTVAELRAWRAAQRTLGMVPTMGALHNGHLSLVKESLQRNDATLVSIFVNPSQFAPGEDLDSYPRTLDSDVHKLNSLLESYKPATNSPGSTSTLSSFNTPADNASSAPNGANSEPSRVAVFCPGVSEMYPSGIDLRVSHQRGTFVEVLGVSSILEGRSRPQFFRGVATVVTKLLNAAQPTVAYFGQKDVQQTVVVRQLVRDLLMPVKIEVLPTVREPNGLAQSSRNAYLSDDVKSRMSIIYKALSKAQSYAKANPTSATAAQITELVTSELGKEKDLISEIEYVSLNSLEDFSSQEHAVTGTVISLAVRLQSGVRLIDNIII